MPLVRHIVSIILRNDLTDAEKRAAAERIKAELEALKAVIPGIVEFTVHIDLLPSSNAHMVFNSLFVDDQALKDYQVHPEHLRAGSFVASVRSQRICVDYYE